jgi:hypothetical protein
MTKETSMKPWLIALFIGLVLGHVQRADAFDAERIFIKGTYVLSIEAGYGEQFDAWDTAITGAGASFFLSDRTALYAGYRLKSCRLRLVPHARTVYLAARKPPERMLLHLPRH